MTRNEAYSLLETLFPQVDTDDIETYVDGPNDSDDYFSKVETVEELRADFEAFLDNA